MGLISDALFKHRSHYYAILPYNLNWRKRDRRALTSLLKDNPIHLVDVGARGSIPDEISPLAKFIDYIGFEADEKEAARLTAVGNPEFAGFRIVNAFVGAEEGPTQFHLYRHLGESSALEPDPACTSFFSELSIDRTVTVDGTTLDALVRDGKIHEIDLIKLDTQGTEYDILQRGQQAVKQALLVETEVEFLPMYKGQKLFHDVCRLLYEYGFQLVYLNRVFLTRNRYNGPSRGQMVFGDALFALQEDLARELPRDKKLKYVVLLMQYGLMDFAHRLYTDDSQIQDAAPQLAEEFIHWRDGRFSRIKRSALMCLDKLIFLALHWRGTNQLTMDSDRSWPVR